MVNVKPSIFLCHTRCSILSGQTASIGSNFFLNGAQPILLKPRNTAFTITTVHRKRINVVMAGEGEQTGKKDQIAKLAEK